MRFSHFIVHVQHSLMSSFTVLALFKWHSTEISLLKTSKCILSMDSQYYVNLLYFALMFDVFRKTYESLPTYETCICNKNIFFNFCFVLSWLLLLILCIYLYSIHYYNTLSCIYFQYYYVNHVGYLCSIKTILTKHSIITLYWISLTLEN